MSVDVAHVGTDRLVEIGKTTHFIDFTFRSPFRNKPRVALEQQQAKNPVMVYAIRPGVIDTEMQQQIREQDETRFAEIEKFKALKRDGQLATADETAAKIAAIIADSPPPGGVYDVHTHRYNE